jgi:hypothetical protein
VKHKILSLCSLGIVVIFDVFLIDFLAENYYFEINSVSGFVSIITNILVLLTFAPSYLYMQWAFKK